MKPRQAIKAIFAALALGLALAVAGCGSSSRAPGIVTAPSAGATADSVTESLSVLPPSPTTTAASVPTPSTGPLSTEPKIVAPKGPAPKALQTKDLIKGTGAVAKTGSTVTVNYVGALYTTGKVFDASWNRKQTFTTPLSTSAVIPGWVQGIAGMRVGGRRELVIPPGLGYKAAAQPGIPANSTLIFIVDLLKVS